MTPLAVRCPHCSTVLRLPQQAPGPIKGQCPKCQAKFEIAQPDPEPAVEAIEATETRRPVPRRTGMPTPDAPAAAAASGTSWLLAGGAVFAVLGVLGIGCVGLGIWAFTSSRDKKPADEQPIAKAPPKKDRADGKEIGDDDGPPPKKDDDLGFKKEPRDDAKKDGLDFDKKEPPANDKTQEPPKKQYRGGNLIIPFDAVATRERLEEIKVVQLKGTVKFFNANNVNDVVIIWESVKRLKYEERTPRTTFTSLLIRDHGWDKRDNRLIALSGNELTFSQNFNYAMILSNLIPLMEDGFEIGKREAATVKGQACYRITVKRTGRPPINLFFDKEANQLVKADFEGRFVGGAKDTFVEFYFSDYQVVDGVKHWRKQEQWRDRKQYDELSVSEVKFFNKANDASFSLPGLEDKIREVLASYEQSDRRDLIRRTLAQLGPDVGSDFTRLVKGIDHADAETRASVRDALRAYARLWRTNEAARFERADVPSLVTLLKSTDADLQTLAVDGITRLGPEADQAASALVSLARDSRDLAALASALVALKNIGVRTEEALSLFEKHLDHPVAAVKDPATLALLQLGPDRLQLNRITELVGRTNAEIRAAATRVLRQRLTAVTAKDLPALRQGLKSPVREVRLAYIDAIGSLKEEGRDAAPELTLLVGSPDNEVSTQAIRALDNLGKLLEIARANTNPAIVAAALGALKTKEVKTEEALAVYEKHLDSFDDGVKTTAALAVIDLAPARLTTDRLIKVMSWPSDEVRAGAGRLLRKKLATLTPQDMPALREGLKSPVREVRLAFIDALGAIKGASAEALPELTPLVASPDKDVAIQACRALEKMGKAADKAVPALAKALDTADVPVAMAATLALFKIDPANGVLKTRGVPLLLEDLKPDLRDMKAFLAKPVTGRAALALLDIGEPAVEPLFRRLLINNDPKKLPEGQQIEGTAARLLGYEMLKEFTKRAKADSDRGLLAALKKQEIRLQVYWSSMESKLAAQARFREGLSPEVRMLYAKTSVAVDQAHRAILTTRIP